MGVTTTLETILKGQRIKKKKKIKKKNNDLENVSLLTQGQIRLKNICLATLSLLTLLSFSYLDKLSHIH